MIKKNSNKESLSVLSNNPSRFGWFIHIFFWGILCFFPFFLIGRNSESVSWIGYSRFLIILSGMIIVFYANYNYLVKRFLFTRQMWQYAISNFLLFTILVLVMHFIMELLPLDDNDLKRHADGIPKRELSHILVFDYIKYIFIAALSVALKMTASWYKTETARKELEKIQSEAELQNLKSQLNPHFLFNTLNNIYSLIAISQERAQDTVHELSRLLRYVLYDSSQPMVSVEKDFAFIRNYVELMRIRLPKHVTLTIDISSESSATQIAPLLFISLVENAFKHGVSNNKPSFIDIKLIEQQHKIVCAITNSYFPKNEQDNSGSGIGLINLTKRLDLLYPNNYTFACKEENEIFYCDLIINLSELKS
ncbi:histidine kinase [Bacteroidales bacterium OttesenSCG-928-M11]|nr:histidine kinase [Bacteroidales bacterium OttesenSCG-928-M11]